MNSVDSLLAEPPFQKSLEEKIEIKKLGRPTPDLDIVQLGWKTKGYRYKRYFHRKLYDEHKWVCGCEVRKALFCFPCLIFGGFDSWSKAGVKDLGHIKEYIRKHSERKKHLNNMLDFSALGSIDFAVQLSRSYQDCDQKVNNYLEKDSHMLSKVIDCVKFCGIFELQLKEYVENDDSDGRGLLFGLFDLVSPVKNKSEHNTISKYTSSVVQNELLDCMYEVCQNVIKEELAEAKYVAIIVDETTDIDNQLQFAIVFRYEFKGNVHERFWGLFKPEQQSVDHVTECILKELNEIFIADPCKLIAQSFGGVSVISGSENSIQASITERFPNAYYVHCYAHELNLVMERAASQVQSARMFFCSLYVFTNFFDRSPQRLSALENLCAKDDQNASSATSNFKSMPIYVVYENKAALIEYCKNEELSHSYNSVQDAKVLRFSLEDMDFSFWLELFYGVIPHVEALYQKLKSRYIDVLEVNDAVRKFSDEMSKIKSNVDTIIIKTEDGEIVQMKRMRIEDNRVADAKEVCDLITKEIQSHFENNCHLHAIKLLDSCFFHSYSLNFPDHILRLVAEQFPNLNYNVLSTELSVLYKRRDFRNIGGVVPLLRLIIRNDLEDTFSELVTLLRIIVTIPMFTWEPERCFTTLERIKSFLKNAMPQDRLTALAMVSLERTLIINMNNFNARVMDNYFSKKNFHLQ